MLPEFQAIIFDMDGTLTIPQHHFEAIRAELDIPSGELILEYLADLPRAEGMRRRAQLEVIERRIARKSKPAEGMHDLLNQVASGNLPVAILTRNSRANAIISLTAIGGQQFFRDDCIVGRDEATPKPDPAGIHLLAQRLGHPAHSCLMIGDYVHDLNAGRNAGCFTVHLCHKGGERWPELTDLRISSLDELNDLIRWSM
jgi:HAD superfamily hydrolase (TIGR01509 family)